LGLTGCHQSGSISGLFYSTDRTYGGALYFCRGGTDKYQWWRPYVFLNNSYA
jgi:hypothetical protein